MREWKKVITITLFAILLFALFGCEHKEAKNIPTVTVNGNEIRISITKVEEVIDAGFQIGFSTDNTFEAYDLSTSDLTIDSGKSFENIELAKTGVSFANITISNYTKENVELEYGTIYSFAANVNNEFKALDIKINGQDIYGKTLTEIQPLFENATLSADGKKLEYHITIDEKYKYTILFTAENGLSVEYIEVKRDTK